MPTALFLSPHLDDAVFSCGGTMALLADAGWRVVLATAFTATVLPVEGFALACQLDKGLSPDVDYMDLRRAEDDDAARLLGAETRHLDLPEAPHRGYGSAAALFGDVREDDDAQIGCAERIAEQCSSLRPDIVFAPQALGGHVDHRQMARAVSVAVPGPIAWYRDMPYAMRDPDAAADRPIGDGWLGVGIQPTLDRKIAAACAYASQIGFQFGGLAAAGLALRDFALSEGGGSPAERFRVNDLPAVERILRAAVST